MRIYYSLSAQSVVYRNIYFQASGMLKWTSLWSTERISNLFKTQKLYLSFRFDWIKPNFFQITQWTVPISLGKNWFYIQYYRKFLFTSRTRKWEPHTFILYLSLNRVTQAGRKRENNFFFIPYLSRTVWILNTICRLKVSLHVKLVDCRIPNSLRVRRQNEFSKRLSGIRDLKILLQGEKFNISGLFCMGYLFFSMVEER